MATAYPSTLPSPMLEGLSATVAMGVLRSDIPLAQAQRRQFITMPHTFMLNFAMDISTLGTWFSWVQTNGYTWFTMPLPSLYAGYAGLDSQALLIRFISDIATVHLASNDVRVSVMAESAPSAISTFLDAT